jgi:hypothetical protein
MISLSGVRRGAFDRVNRLASSPWLALHVLDKQQVACQPINGNSYRESRFFLFDVALSFCRFLKKRLFDEVKRWPLGQRLRRCRWLIQG